MEPRRSRSVSLALSDVHLLRDPSVDEPGLEVLELEGRMCQTSKFQFLGKHVFTQLTSVTYRVEVEDSLHSVDSN